LGLSFGEGGFEGCGVGCVLERGEVMWEYRCAEEVVGGSNGDGSSELMSSGVAGRG
jgi:hypothetical protein